MTALRLEYYSNVKDGSLQLNVRKQIANDIKYFEGKRVEIRIEKLRSKRSSAQNRLFHMYVGIIAKELGYEFEEMKDILKYKFLLKEKVDEKTGEVFKYLGHTSRLSKSEFADLVTGVIQFAAEYGITLPLPGEQFKIFDDEQ